MRLIDVFFPKERQKVTEQYLRQVLATSICGILLCMSCLAGTTWAWFVVDIDNGVNVIDIASVPPEVTITVKGSPLDSSNPNLSKGVNELHIAHNGETDDLQYKSTLYVTLSVDHAVQGYVTLCADNQYQANVQITTEQDAFLSYTASWFEPTMLAGDLIDLYVEAESEPTEETTAPTEETTAPTEETTAPTEETTAPTEETTAPTEETTAPTEETTAPTEETTAPTEETTAPTEETTAPTEDETDPTTETTTPTEPTTQPTEAVTEPDEGAEQPGGTEGEPEETYTEPLDSETSDTEEEP